MSLVRAVAAARKGLVGPSAGRGGDNCIATLLFAWQLGGEIASKMPREGHDSPSSCRHANYHSVDKTVNLL